jgi:sortase A
MRRFVSLAGTLLMLVGIVILIYVGVSYARGQALPTAPSWNAAQKAKGQQIAARLATPQTVKIPHRLRTRQIAPGSEPAYRIVIPKIAVDAPVVETPPVNGVWDVADWAVGHLTSTPNPGAPGNMALSAHDDIKGEVFKRLGDLAPGDKVLLYTRHAVYTYTVVSQQAVDPSDVAVLDPTRTATVTLISCAPYWVDTQRLVVQAVLKARRAA